MDIKIKKMSTTLRQKIDFNIKKLTGLSIQPEEK